jgi:hypothetical protein
MGNLVKLCRAGDRALQLLLFNEEFLVSVSHQLALITSLPFVHTARRYYRLNGLVRPPDWLWGVGDDTSLCGDVYQTPIAFIMLPPPRFSSFFGVHCNDSIHSCLPPPQYP